MPAPPTFSPELVEAARQRLRELLGPVWKRIEREDEQLQQAGQPDGDRHLLALLDQRAYEFLQEFRELRLPGHMPDCLAFLALSNVLDRSQGDDVFEEILPRLPDRDAFRHDMLTLGLADHIRTNTPYTVGLPTRSPTGQRIVDLIICDEAGARIEVETKARREFDGPRRRVTAEEAWKAIRYSGKAALGTERPQLSGVLPGAILVGGITLEVASLTTIERVARRWLERAGAEHPNLWGILVQTYWTHSRLPAGRSIGDGKALTFNAYAGVQLRAAPNPYYDGPARIVLRPSVPDT